MATAYFANKKIAESDNVQFVEGAVWFPQDRVQWEFLPRVSEYKAHCSWKGDGEYFDVVVDGNVAPAGALRYPDIYYTGRALDGWITFRQGIEVRI